MSIQSHINRLESRQPITKAEGRSIQAQIEGLLVQAADLRPLPEDEPARAPLAGIIDHINQLRALQADPKFVDREDHPLVRFKPAKRGVLEGEDA